MRTTAINSTDYSSKSLRKLTKFQKLAYKRNILKSMGHSGIKITQEYYGRIVQGYRQKTSV
jgi:hypothetical protein